MGGRGAREKGMSECNESESSIHALLNEATEWLQYARSVMSTLADHVHEADKLDHRELALSLEATAAMTQAGVERVRQAHAKWVWEQEAAGRLQR
jgi:hypothetical protein